MPEDKEPVQASQCHTPRARSNCFTGVDLNIMKKPDLTPLKGYAWYLAERAKEIKLRWKTDSNRIAQAEAWYREHLEPVSADDPNEKTALLARMYHHLLEHPLCKRYLTSAPELYIDPTSLNTGVISDNVIVLSADHFNEWPLDQLLATLAHELGHILRKDISQGGVSSFFNQSQERGADKISVMLLGAAICGKALQSQLDLVLEMEEMAKDQSFLMGVFDNAHIQAQKRAYLIGGRHYPSIPQRIAAMETFETKLKDPETREDAEREIIDQIEKARHRRVPNYGATR